MHQKLTSFSPEAMRALGQQIAEERRHRADDIEASRSQVVAMLHKSRRARAEAARERRTDAAGAAEARKLYASELTSGVHAMLGRFDIVRQEMASDHREMARELQETFKAWRSRPSSRGRAIRPAC